MSDHFKETIAHLREQVRKQEKEIEEKKHMVNMLCVEASMPPVYAQIRSAANEATTTLRRDQFYGRPLSTVIKEFLEMRRTANLGPATVGEIYDALLAGGYNFESKDSANAKRGLRVSLTKNTSIFHRLPDGKTFGLASWYPKIKENGKASKSVANTDTDGQGGGDGPDEHEAIANTSEGDGGQE